MINIQNQQRGNNQTQSTSTFSKKKPKIKTASTLAWAFPGMGHYYSGRFRKGLLFTGLEIIFLSSTINNSYASLSEEYAMTIDKLNNAATEEKYNSYKLEADQLLKNKNEEQE